MVVLSIRMRYEVREGSNLGSVRVANFSVFRHDGKTALKAAAELFGAVRTPEKLRHDGICTSVLPWQSRCSGCPGCKWACWKYRRMGSAGSTAHGRRNYSEVSRQQCYITRRFVSSSKLVWECILQGSNVQACCCQSCLSKKGIFGRSDRY